MKTTKNQIKQTKESKEPVQKKQNGKIFEGIVISAKMKNTVIVGVTVIHRHPLYKKAMKRTQKFAVDTNGQTAVQGDAVRIIEVRPISKTKRFKILEVLK